MYRVLVVDDEINIAKGIAFLIQRGLPECTVEGIAQNGREGIQMALQLRPDIILTDIRMPEMDGIEMIRSLKKTDMNCHYMILSGYSEFEYARSAVSLGVEEYITKPVEEEELYRAFEKICAAIQKRRNLEKQSREMEDRLLNYSNDMKAYRLKALLEGTGILDDTGKNRLKEAGIPTDCCQYTCVVIETAKEIAGERSNVFRSVAENILKEEAQVYELAFSSTERVLFLAVKKKCENKRFLSLLGRIRFAFAEQLNTPVSIGAGMLHNKIEETGAAYKEAKCAANYKVIKGSDCVISYEEIRNIPEIPRMIAEEDVKYLETCMDEMDDAGCRWAVEQIFRKLETEKGMSLEILQNISLGLILVGIKKMPFALIQINEYLGRDILSLESISKFQTIDQLKNWIINVLTGINELMLKQETEKKQDVVEEVKKYLSKNFNKEISLADISEKFFINPSYFSQIFKKKTGVTYQNYLTGLRIKRARKLLEETDLKIYEVSEMVGYADTNYFSRIFERTVGIKPSEYRKHL